MASAIDVHHGLFCKTSCVPLDEWSQSRWGQENLNARIIMASQSFIRVVDLLGTEESQDGSKRGSKELTWWVNLGLKNCFSSVIKSASLSTIIKLFVSI